MGCLLKVSVLCSHFKSDGSWGYYFPLMIFTIAYKEF